MPVYTVKNIKTFRGHEGHGFNVSLYCDNKKVAFVMDQADGHPVIIEWDDPSAEGVLNNHIKDMTYTFYETVNPMTADIFIAQLVDRVENEKAVLAQQKRWIKNQTVFHIKGEPEGDFRTVKSPFSKKIKEFIINKYGDQVEYILNERHGQIAV